MSSKTSLKMCLLTVLILLISMAGSANADYIFGTPTNLGPIVNSTSNEQAPNISADGLELYFSEYQGAPYIDPVDKAFQIYGLQPDIPKTTPGASL